MSSTNNPAIADTVESTNGIVTGNSDDIDDLKNHIFSIERWLGVATAPVGETHRADIIGPSVVEFTVISGNNDWGAWVQILGSNDTPIYAGNTFFHPSRAQIRNAETTSTYLIQMAAGESVDLAAKIAAGTFMEFPYIGAALNNSGGITDAIGMDVAAGQKLWARCITPARNVKNIKFMLGIHEF